MPTAPGRSRCTRLGRPCRHRRGAPCAAGSTGLQSVFDGRYGVFRAHLPESAAFDAAEPPPDRHGVPGLRAVPASDGRRKRRLRPAGAAGCARTTSASAPSACRAACCPAGSAATHGTRGCRSAGRNGWSRPGPAPPCPRRAARSHSPGRPAGRWCCVTEGRCAAAGRHNPCFSELAAPMERIVSQRTGPTHADPIAPARRIRHAAQARPRRRHPPRRAAWSGCRRVQRRAGDALPVAVVSRAGVHLAHGRWRGLPRSAAARAGRHLADRRPVRGHHLGGRSAHRPVAHVAVLGRARPGDAVPGGGAQHPHPGADLPVLLRAGADPRPRPLRRRRAQPVVLRGHARGRGDPRQPAGRAARPVGSRARHGPAVPPGAAPHRAAAGAAA